MALPQRLARFVSQGLVVEVAALRKWRGKCTRLVCFVLNWSFEVDVPPEVP